MYESTAEDTGIPKDVLSPERMAARGLKKDPDAFLENVWQVVHKVKSYGLSPQAFRDLARQQCLAFGESLKRLPIEPSMTTVQALYDAWRKPLQAFSSTAWEADFLPLNDYASQKEAYKTCLDPQLFKRHPAIQIKRLPKIEGLLPPDAVDWSALNTQTQRELDWIDVITAVYALYQERLFLDAVIDYDDQINLTLQTLQRHPALRRKYQEWFDAIMVDEFQDTNGSQLALLKCLMRHPENGWQDVENHGNLTIVGDVKQSIYSFRFAQKENVSLVFEGVKPKQVSLIRNYRCRAGILHVANQVADATAENPAERDAHLLACKASDDKAPTEATAYYFGVQLDEAKWEDSKSLRLEHAVQTLVQNLLTAHQAHPRESEEHTNESPPFVSPFAWRDYCVLGRSHQQLQSVADYLEAKRIPYVMERDGALFKLPIIQVASAFLQILHQPEDRTAWVSFLQSLLPPLRLLHAVEAVHLKQKQSPESPQHFALAFLEGLSQQKGLSLERFQTIEQLTQRLLETHQQEAMASPQRLFKAWHSTILALQRPLQAQTEEATSQKEVSALLAFSDLCQRHYERLGKRYSLKTLLQALEQDRQNPQFKLPLKHMQSTNRLNAVKLMTFHASKGLEFPHVHVLWFGNTPPNQDGMSFDPQFKPKQGVGFLIHKDANDDNTLKYELYKSLWQKPRSEYENRRLFYVALTRAEKSVTLYTDAQKLEKESWLRLMPNQDHSQQVQIYEEALMPEAFQEIYTAFQQSVPLEAVPVLTPNSLEPRPNLTPKVKASLNVWQAKQQQAHRISFSALQQLEACPLQYWYQHIRQIPTPQEAKANTPLNDLEKAALRGKTVHRLIETYYRYAVFTQETVLHRRLEDVIQQVLGDLDLSERQTLESQAWQVYQQFLESPYTLEALSENGYDVLAPEQSIEFLLPKRLTGRNLNFKVKGQVDAILYHRPSDTYGILDFKTNAKLDDTKLNTYYEQIALYRLGFQLNNPHVSIERERCQLVHLTPQQAVKPYPLPNETPNSTPEGLSTWLRNRLSQLDALLASPDAIPSASASPPCFQCAFRSICGHPMLLNS